MWSQTNLWNLATWHLSLSKGVKNRHFPRMGTLLLLFWNLKNSEKSVPLREKPSKGVKNIRFPPKGTFFFYYFEKIVWKRVPVREETVKRSEKHKFSSEGCTFFTIFFFLYRFCPWWLEISWITKTLNTEEQCWRQTDRRGMEGRKKKGTTSEESEFGWIDVKISFKVRPSCRGHCRADGPETIRLRETYIPIL